MGGLGIWLRAEGRRRWRAWLAIAIVAGVGWGAVMVAVAGARRTDTAFARFREVFKGRDLLASPFGDGRELSKAVAGLPEVTSAGRIIGLNAFVVDPTPPSTFAFGAPLIALDDKAFRTIDRPKILRGRLPRLDAADEALVSPSFVDPLHIGVGDWVTLQPQTSADPDSGKDPIPGESFRVRIVGVGVTQAEAFPISTFDRLQPLMVLTPAAYTAYWKEAYAAFDGVAVRLRPGTDIAAFQAEVKALQKRYPESGEDIFFAAETDRPPIARRAFRPQVAALLAFAAALGLTLILVVSQSVVRQISIHAGDYPTLRAIGMSPGRLLSAAVTPAVAGALVAGVIAVIVAILVSPLTPIGGARIAEPHPGIAMDAVVLAPGALVLVLWISSAAAIASRRVARVRDEAAAVGRTSRLAQGLSGAGFPVPTAAGVRMALEPGRGTTAVPVRTVIVSAMVSMVALAAAFTFGASLDRAVRTPRIFGQRWNTTVDAQFDALFPDRLGYKTDPAYEAVAGGMYAATQVRIGNESVAAIGIRELKGSAFPTLLEGRPPRTGDEIVLGTSTLRRLGGRVGQTIEIERPGEGKRRVRVVGRAVLPSFGIGSFTPTGLGEGAVVTPEGLGPTFLPPGGYSFVLVRFAKDASPAVIRRVDHACDNITAAGELCLVRHNQQPPEIESYAQVRNVSWVLAGVLAALTAATLAHGLVATVRRRRRDLAVLKTLGFVRRQISAAVAWQATTQVVVALVGIPLGIAAGRWAWVGLADQLGIPAEPRVPLLVIALTIPALVVLGNVVAALPGRAASRTQAALVLRTE